MQQILTENEEKLAHWRAVLKSALSINGQVVIEVIPEVELVIGILYQWYSAVLISFFRTTVSSTEVKQHRQSKQVSASVCELCIIIGWS